MNYLDIRLRIREHKIDEGLKMQQEEGTATDKREGGWGSYVLRLSFLPIVLVMIRILAA